MLTSKCFYLFDDNGTDRFHPLSLSFLFISDTEFLVSTVLSIVIIDSSSLNTKFGNEEEEEIIPSDN